MVVLAAVITVAVLTNASLDRGSAAALSTRYQTELACQSGLEAAKKALQATALVSGIPTSRTQNDDFIVVSVNDSNGVPYYFAGSCQDPTNSGSSNYASPGIQYFPLFSGGTTQSGLTVTTAGAAPTPNPTPASGTRAQQMFGTTPMNYPTLFKTDPYLTWQKSIYTNWQTVPLTGTTQEYRYTYWIEDLAGYTDAKVAGNIDGTGSTNLRSLGYNPKEEGLFTLFSATSQADPGSTYASTFLVPNHPVLNTRLSTRLGTTAGSSDDTACLTSLAANLQGDSEQLIIPHGLGYKNEGQAKTNLNSVLQSKDDDTGVTQIATAISDNLPAFASTRQGGLDSSQDYLKTLAANILGYINGVPLVGSNYRGIGLYPFVVEYCDQFLWSSKGFYVGGGGDYLADVTVTPFLQVWNMFATQITSGVLRFVDQNKTGISIGTCPQSGCSGTTRSSFVLTSFDKLDTAANRSPMEGSIDFSANQIGQNQYQVYALPSRTYTVDTGSKINPDIVSPNPTPAVYIGLPSNTNSDDTQSYYQVYWNGTLVDRPGISNYATTDPKYPSYMVRPNSTLNRNGKTPDFHTTLPGLRYSDVGSSGPFNLGDPRGSYFIKATQYANTYTDSSWGGRIRMWTYFNNTWPAGEARPAGWPDGGHNTTYPGPSPNSSGTEIPTAVAARAAPSPVPDTYMAPARVSSGKMTSITELGYVYDPFQWDPFGSTKPTSTASVDQGWRDAWKNGFKAKSASYTSHSTLRIGRPEFKDFDATPASQLLDIFSAGDPADPTTAGRTANQISTLGKINLNTASVEVLRSLGAGIQIGNLNLSDVDEDIQNANGTTTVYGPTSGAGAKAADAFANAVVSYRTSHPFLSTSQLAQITATDKKGTSTPFFGNPDQWLNNDGPKAETNDQTTTGGNGNTVGVVDWNDAASEQYFGKLFNFATVRSRNFRVFVTGQVYDASANRVIATANRVYEVYLEPTRDSNSTPPGNITGQTCEVTYAANLPQ